MSKQTPTVMNDTALRAAASAAPTRPCTCTVGPCLAWESLAEDRWPAGQMDKVGTLRDAQQYEPTFEEFHPQGTRYDSVDAPVAAQYFPYNRCDVFCCQQCSRNLMRYTEFGGYYVDHRVRELRAQLLVSSSAQV
jgi:hypothetical protein